MRKRPTPKRTPCPQETSLLHVNPQHYTQSTRTRANPPNRATRDNPAPTPDLRRPATIVPGRVARSTVAGTHGVRGARRAGANGVVATEAQDARRERARHSTTRRPTNQRRQKSDEAVQVSLYGFIQHENRSARGLADLHRPDQRRTSDRRFFHVSLCLRFALRTYSAGELLVTRAPKLPSSRDHHTNAWRRPQDPETSYPQELLLLHARPQRIPAIHTPAAGGERVLRRKSNTAPGRSPRSRGTRIDLRVSSPIYIRQDDVELRIGASLTIVARLTPRATHVLRRRASRRSPRHRCLRRVGIIVRRSPRCKGAAGAGCRRPQESRVIHRGPPNSAALASDSQQASRFQPPR
jgi:hypothetical protein